ncbi:MAG TPA: hypothetical protein VJ691_01080 [Vicinamibacterales bacterium]|nr:hypothetical protein [Vicinamibacterales bacterium]
MSRNLPDRPNLEFLRKEAKAVLASMQQRDPEAQLADAQFALARDYGFDSWPKLKTHVESATAAANPLAGRWIADVSRSKRHPANQFRSATIVFAVDGTTVSIADEFVDETGKTVRGRNTIEADGVARSMGNGFVVTATWLAPNDLETLATKNGEEVGRGRYTVSEDGRHLTIVSNDDQVIVLDRAGVPIARTLRDGVVV